MVSVGLVLVWILCGCLAFHIGCKSFGAPPPDAMWAALMVVFGGPIGLFVILFGVFIDRYYL